MADKITNELIYKKILELEKSIKKIAEEEDLIVNKEKFLEKSEQKELGLLKKLHGKNVKKRFDDILQWKQLIWDGCPDKKTVKSKDKKEIDFICRKTGKSCRFLDCYRNKME